MDARESERMASRTMLDAAWKSRPGPSTYRTMLPSLSRNVFAEDRQRPRDRATVLTSVSRDIAMDRDQSTADSRRDSADRSRDCSAANIPRESPGTRVCGLPVYEDHSLAN